MQKILLNLTLFSQIWLNDDIRYFRLFSEISDLLYFISFYFILYHIVLFKIFTLIKNIRHAVIIVRRC